MVSIPLSCVSMTTDQLVSEMLSLPDDVRAEVVDRVLLESHGGQASEHKQAWSHVFRPAADAEYVEAATYYAGVNGKLAASFMMK